jgi:putative hydrolase of the HAD superfamily
MIKAIIFDWFGVCTVENWGECVKRELNKKLGIDESVIRKEYKKLLLDFMSARLSPDEFMKKLIESLDKNQNYKDFLYLFTMIPELNKKLLDFILQLKRNYKVFLLSNTVGPLYEEFKKKLDFNKYFDKLFLSHELKLDKMQEEIWKIVLSEIEYQPEELVFIDNKDHYLELARKVNVNTILFKNNDQVKKDLTELGVKIE